jgi:hypothetical protein
MPREEIDFKDPCPSSPELGVEFVGRRLFGDDWIGKLSIADLKLLEQYGPKIEFRNGVEVRTINPCPERIRNAYRVHEPTNGLGLLATLVFATESSYSTPSAHVVESLHGERVLNSANPLHRALLRLSKMLESEKGAAANAAAKGYSM